MASCSTSMAKQGMPTEQGSGRCSMAQPVQQLLVCSALLNHSCWTNSCLGDREHPQQGLLALNWEERLRTMLAVRDSRNPQFLYCKGHWAQEICPDELFLVQKMLDCKSSPKDTPTWDLTPLLDFGPEILLVFPNFPLKMPHIKHNYITDIVCSNSDINF